MSSRGKTLGLSTMGSLVLLELCCLAIVGLLLAPVNAMPDDQTTPTPGQINYPQEKKIRIAIAQLRVPKARSPKVEICHSRN